METTFSSDPLTQLQPTPQIRSPSLKYMWSQQIPTDENLQSVFTKIYKITWGHVPALSNHAIHHVGLTARNRLPLDEHIQPREHLLYTQHPFGQETSGKCHAKGCQLTPDGPGQRKEVARRSFANMGGASELLGGQMFIDRANLATIRRHILYTTLACDWGLSKQRADHVLWGEKHRSSSRKAEVRKRRTNPKT